MWDKKALLQDAAYAFASQRHIDLLIENHTRCAVYIADPDMWHVQKAISRTISLIIPATCKTYRHQSVRYESPHDHL